MVTTRVWDVWIAARQVNLAIQYRNYSMRRRPEAGRHFARTSESPSPASERNQRVRSGDFAAFVPIAAYKEKPNPLDFTASIRVATIRNQANREAHTRVLPGVRCVERTGDTKK